MSINIGTAPNSRYEYGTLNGRTRDDYDFQIDIKTIAEEGIVFYSTDLSKQELIALYIKDGLVSLSPLSKIVIF